MNMKSGVYGFLLVLICLVGVSASAKPPVRPVGIYEKKSVIDPTTGLARESLISTGHVLSVLNTTYNGQEQITLKIKFGQVIGFYPISLGVTGGAALLAQQIEMGLVSIYAKLGSKWTDHGTTYYPLSDFQIRKRHTSTLPTPVNAYLSVLAKQTAAEAVVARRLQAENEASVRQQQAYQEQAQRQQQAYREQELASARQQTAQNDANLRQQQAENEASVRQQQAYQEQAQRQQQAYQEQVLASERQQAAQNEANLKRQQAENEASVRQQQAYREQELASERQQQAQYEANLRQEQAEYEAAIRRQRAEYEAALRRLQ